MAAMSAADRNKVARIFARRVYAGDVCNVHGGDIVAAVGAIDDAFEGQPGDLPNPGQSVAANLNLSLPEPFKTAATVPQKGTLLAIWSGVKYGYVTGGGE